MRILLVHAFYKTPGGEDAVVENEKAMLERRGHTVDTYFTRNSDIDTYSRIDKALVVPRAIFNPTVAKQLDERLSTGAFDIVHIHNFWPTLSPSMLFVLKNRGMPFVQTIHNYRYIAANGILYRDDVEPTTHRLTLKRRPMGHFRNSAVLTLTYTLAARLVRTSKVIDCGPGVLQVLNRFSKDVLGQLFDMDKLVVRGNFLPDAVVKQLAPQPKENYYLYLGRLSEEKGLVTLIDAFRRLDTDASLIIAGAGPMESYLKTTYGNLASVRFVGYVCGQQKIDLIAKAKALVIPSEWQEVFPITVMEAAFASTPIIAARIGGLPDMVEERQTGLLFESGDMSDLANKLAWCEQHPQRLAEMGPRARNHAEHHFSEADSYTALMGIYEQVIRTSA